MITENKVRIAVLVSGSGSNLQALLDAQGSVLNSGEVVLVVANRPDAYGLERAQARSVATVCLPNPVHKNRETAAEYDRNLARVLKENQIELVVLAGWLRILGPEFLQHFPNRVINIHPSLLPEFGGKNYYGLKVHQAVIAKGRAISGATVHYVEQEIDAGPIICQESLPVQPTDTPQTLQKRILTKIEWKILPEATQKVAAEILENRKVK